MYVDSGHVYKVVFGLGEDGESFPIISEDFEVCLHVSVMSHLMIM